MAFTVVYDADVLYPASLRDLLLEMARTGEYRARFTAEILDEVFGHLAADYADVEAERWSRLRALVERSVRDAVVTGHMELVPSLDLPDPDDRHVLAAAIKAGAQVIVSNDRSGFPAEALEPWGIERQSADTFVHHVTDLHPEVVLGAIARISARLANPSRSPAEVLDSLERAGLVQTALRVRSMLP